MIPAGGLYVLRGDRQLAVRVTYGKAKQSVTVKSTEDIIQLLDKYQTGYVIVEKPMPKAADFPEYKLLLQTVKNTAKFKLQRKFPIHTNYRKPASQLFVYQFEYDKEKKINRISIPVPTLGYELNASF